MVVAHEAYVGPSSLGQPPHGIPNSLVDTTLHTGYIMNDMAITLSNDSNPSFDPVLPGLRNDRTDKNPEASISASTLLDSVEST